MDLYSAFIVVRHTQGAQVRISQCYLQITPYLPRPRKRSPDGASPDWGCGHIIAAYYSLIYPKGWKAESAWLADLQRTVYPHEWSPVSHRSSAGQWKFACQRPTFYTTVPRNQLILHLVILYRIHICTWHTDDIIGSIEFDIFKYRSLCHFRKCQVKIVILLSCSVK